MKGGVNSYTSFFAGEAKVMRRVEKELNHQKLQKDTDKFHK